MRNGHDDRILEEIREQYSQLVVYTQELPKIAEEIKLLREQLIETLQGKTPEGYVSTKTHMITLLAAVGVLKADAIGSGLSQVLVHILGK